MKHNQQHADQSASPPFALVIHGGAGHISSMPTALECQHRSALESALQAGYQVLKSGRSAVESVEAAIRILEDCPLFNAGRGAVFTADQRHELDAAIMDGRNRQAGSVAGLMHIANPISLAKTVMEKSQHVMLIGEGAEHFASQQGITLVDNDYFSTDKRLKQLQQIQRLDPNMIVSSEADDYFGSLHSHTSNDPNSSSNNPIDDKKFGTVGAVALDQSGNIAAGTSTGGLTNKRFGRVGDSPIIGAGTYADNPTAAISATGHGEFFIRNAVAHDICAQIEYRDIDLATAANNVIHGKLRHMEGEGGIIGLNSKGDIVMEFNSSGMFRGYITQEGKAKTLIYQKQ